MAGELQILGEALNEGVSPKFDLKSTGNKERDRDVLHNPKEFKVELKYMPPSEFLKAIKYKTYIINYKKVDNYAKSFTNETVLPTPIMIYDKIGDTTAYRDGAHRALALQKLGVKKMPVFVGRVIGPKWDELKEGMDWSEADAATRKLGAVLGMGPDYKPTPPTYYGCPKCDCKEAVIKEVHADTDMNEFEGRCPACKYSGAVEEFSRL